MTHPTNGRSPHAPLLEGGGAARDPEQVLLELRAELLARIDSALGQIGSMAVAPAVAPMARREDPLGRRLRRSVMFRGVKGAGDSSS